MDSLRQVFNFFNLGKTQAGENFFLSQNRSEFTSRLINLVHYLQGVGFNTNGISLIVSCAGEVGNNSFDHNLGYWKDQPGVAMGWVFEKNKLTLGFSDRGRGIVSSLQPVVKPQNSSQEIINMAFEKVITGRAPEKRGNVLKIVCNSIQGGSENSLVCYANQCLYQISESTPLSEELKSLTQNYGTILFMQWVKNDY